MNNPFLSVVIPTYNRKDSLALTLRGLGSQTYPADGFEVIVVSDGSTDGTEEMVAAAAPGYPFALRFFTQENGGPSRARNRGVEEARGAVIVFIDDDVEPEPGFLAAHARHHEAADDAVVIGPMLPDPARRASEPVWIAWEHGMLEKQYCAWRTGEWPGAGPNHFYSGNASVRRRHLCSVGGFDPSFTRQEDVELAYRMERHCRVHFLYDSEAVGLHRPLRKFDGWKAVPAAYGRLDVTRALRTGEAAGWKTVRHNYHARNGATRAVARAVIACPALLPLLTTLLRGAAQAVWRLGYGGAALSALSALYNVIYLDAARSAIGSARGLRQLLIEGVPPAVDEVTPRQDTPRPERTVL